MPRAEQLFPYGHDLTGAECRTLRASLNLERRHVVAFANAMALADRVVTLPLLTNWERSKARGYPGPLARGLLQLEEGVQAMSERLAADAQEAIDRALELILVRPVGARRIHQLLSAHYVFRTAELEALEEGGGDFFQVLADAALVRALLAFREAGRHARVVFDPEGLLDTDEDPPVTITVGRNGLSVGQPFLNSRRKVVGALEISDQHFPFDAPVMLEAHTHYRLELFPEWPRFLRAVKSYRLQAPATPRGWATFRTDIAGAHLVEALETRQEARQTAREQGLLYGRISDDGAMISDHPASRADRPGPFVKQAMARTRETYEARGWHVERAVLGSPDADAFIEPYARKDHEPGRLAFPVRYRGLTVEEDEDGVRSFLWVCGPGGQNDRAYF